MDYKNSIQDLNEGRQLNEYMTPREVMDMLYIGKNTLYHLLGTGELKGFRIGKLWRVSRQSLLEYVARSEERL